MDNGEVINALNEGWTFIGANLTEWLAGFMMMLFVGSALKLSPVGGMPVFLTVLVTVTFGMAALRNRFPDGTRGLANLCASSMGFCPPGIPRPAKMQPFWSGCPLKEIDEKKDYVHLDLDEMFELMYEEKYKNE